MGKIIVKIDHDFLANGFSKNVEEYFMTIMNNAKKTYGLLPLDVNYFKRFVLGSDVYDKISLKYKNLIDKYLGTANGYAQYDGRIVGIPFKVSSSIGPREVIFEWEERRQPLYDEFIVAPPSRFLPTYNNYQIKEVIFNPPATIVLWEDGAKTVVKDQDTDIRTIKYFDKEKGLAMAICKKVLGTNKSKSNYYNEFKKWLEK